MSENKVLGIVFSNMHDEKMGDLTMVRTMGSVPFGGRYRLVDFALSNMINAGIRDVGMITKSNYHSLMDHVGSGREWDLARKIGGLTILPPFARAGAGMYRGNLDALSKAPFPEDLRSISLEHEGMTAQTVSPAHFYEIWNQAQERPDGFMGMFF